MEIWQTVLFAIGGNAVLLVVLGVLGKSFLDKIIARDTKRFELDIQAKANSAIEHLKNQLQLKTIEHQVRFSRLHEKRASVIAELYGYLVESLWEAETFLSPMQWAGDPDKNVQHATAMNKLAEFYRFFDKHRIYLPDVLCISLEEFVSSVRGRVISYGVYVQIPEGTRNETTLKQMETAWRDGWDEIKVRVPQARKVLETEFRQLLGALPQVAGTPSNA